VSVVIPLYNKAPYIEAALRSVQAQSFTDLEIIVVDDGSTDGGAALVEGFDDPRILLIRQANAGAGAARNTGIAAARGRWIAFLDADDLWRPDKTARQLQLLEAHPDVVWAAGAFVRMTPEGPAANSAPIPSKLFTAEGVVEDALALLAVGGAIWTSTVMVRRAALGEVGAFDPSLRTGQDRDLWVRLAVEHPRIAYVQERTALKCEVPGSLTAQKIAEGFSSTLQLARQRIAIAKSLSAPRSTLLQAFVHRSLEKHARQEFAANRAKAAQEALGLMRSLDLGPPSRLVRIAAHVPSPALRLFISSRRKFQRWLSLGYRKSGRVRMASRIR
jgi:glycosyltransferase involved in cell wall biosynthesis